MTTESLKIDWQITCEKCLGEMVKRRINLGNGKKKMVMQCKRCRFFKEIED
ncbi:MAG: hypothetical protein ACFFCS_14820 [Candidatus Hodarchaeota archaeon]